MFSKSPWMPFLLMLHSSLALLVKIPLMLVNIKPYLEGPRVAGCRRSAATDRLHLLNCLLRVCFSAPVGVEEHGCAFCLFAGDAQMGCTPTPTPSVFSPLMSLFVASNTYQLAQRCIAPNILTELAAFTTASLYCLFRRLFLSF